MQFRTFERKCLEVGLVALDRGKGHWQVKGKLLVNFYPDKGTIYIAGTTKGVYVEGIEQVIKATDTLPDAFSSEWFKREERKQNTKHKQRLFRAHPYCHICGLKVEYKEASVDHMIPLSKGGLNNANNFKLAHISCNQERGNRV